MTPPTLQFQKFVNFSKSHPVICSLAQCSLETPKRELANSADPDQMPQNVVSKQGLHYLQIVQPVFSRNI